MTYSLLSMLIFQDSDASVFLCCVLPGIFLAIMVYVTNQQAKNQKEEMELKLSAIKSIDKVDIGKPLTGVRNSTAEDKDIVCAITNDYFVFLRGKGEEIDKIRRDSINQIVIDDKSQITQRITVARLLTLGIFSLAAPKSEKQLNFCLLIDWNDEQGNQENAIFEFNGSDSNIKATNAANLLKKYVLPKVARLKTGEKKCPYCAEVIKQEAVVCRYCGKDLPQEQPESASSQAEHL